MITPDGGHSIEALKREVTVEDGRVVLEGLPVADGQTVEVIVLIEGRRLAGVEAASRTFPGLRAERGGAEGLFFVSEDFDPPMPGLADYQP